MKLANHLVRKAKQFSDITLNLEPTPADRVRFLLCTDASWGNASNGGSQGAFVIAAVDQGISEGKMVDMSMLQWRSSRVRRVCV